MMCVAAYCRVSTDKDDQMNSFESQKKFFEEHIGRNPEWELYEIYADEGLSGTNTKKRKSFNKMIADAHLGKFSLILTKEVSRFARNTVDTLQYTRDLAKIGVGVNFLLDNISTLEQDGELRLTIMASMAQEESRKTSQRVKWGQMQRMKRGVVFGRDCLGYDVEGGKMTVNEEGAKIIGLIYHKFVNEKKGTCTIARELREAGIKTFMGNSSWSNTTILKILRNEKYCGDLCQKKTITPDFLTHEKKYNRGEEEMVFIKDHHTPIINRELWDEAQCILNKNRPSEGDGSQYSNRYPLSGKIKCGHCGMSFSAKYKRRDGPTPYKGWHCNTHSTQGKKHIDSAGNEVGCDLNCQISEKDFMAILAQVMATVKVDRKKITDGLCDALSVVLTQDTKAEGNAERLKKEIADEENKKKKLLDLYYDGDLTKDEFRKEKEELTENINAKRSKLLELERKVTVSYDVPRAVNEIREHISDVFDGVKQDEAFYKYVLDKIVVFSREKMDVYLNLLPFRWRVVENSFVSDKNALGT